MSVQCEAPSLYKQSLNGRPPSDIEIDLSRPERSWYPIVRTVVEYPAALVLLVLTSPLIFVAAILIKATSRGPAIYSQVRLGRGGRPFRVLKIRSMRHDCEKYTGPLWSNGRDPRVLPVGRVIRRLHIDELPQLWNVLRGDMSLIGPRPERPEFVVKLEQAIPRYSERLSVRPGITGLAQVQLPPDVDRESVRRKLAYDLYYIDNMGAWLDMRITFSTLLKMMGMRFGALRRIFAMPPAADVEAEYWRLVPLADALPQLAMQPS